MDAFKVGFLIFPNLTQLDFTGPLQVLSRLPGAEVHIIAKTQEPVPSDCGLGLVPTCTLADCPDLDLLCIPGGIDVTGPMTDPETQDFVKRQGQGARYLTSVCTGMFVLGAAGLLAGRKANTHWAFADLVPLTGAEQVPERVVRDGNLFTAGGVTSGIDFALTIVAEIAGPDVARTIQLGIEYDPAPPFDAGSPDRVAPEIKARLDARYETAHAKLRGTIEGLSQG